MSTGIVRRCAVEHTVPGRHLDGCTDTDCRGCSPAAAARQLWVCRWHERRVDDGLAALPGLYADLGDPRRGKGTAGGGGAGLPMSDERRDARTAIRATLTDWCLTLKREHARTLPANTVRAMAGHVRTHRDPLLAGRHAVALVADLLGVEDADGVRQGAAVVTVAWRLARPGRGTAVRILCTCGHRVPLDVDPSDPGGLITCPNCGEYGTVRWWRDRLAGDVDGPRCADDVIAWLILERGLPIDSERMHTRIRQWAARGLLTRQGRDERGRTLYDPEQVLAVYTYTEQRTARPKRARPA